MQVNYKKIVEVSFHTFNIIERIVKKLFPTIVGAVTLVYLIVAVASTFIVLANYGEWGEVFAAYTPFFLLAYYVLKFKKSDPD